MSDAATLPLTTDTQLLEERDVWLSGPFLGRANIQAVDATAGSAYIFANFAPARITPDVQPYRLLGAGWETFCGDDSELLFFVNQANVTELVPWGNAFVPYWGWAYGRRDFEPTFSYSAPMFRMTAGTGDDLLVEDVLIQELHNSLDEWEKIGQGEPETEAPIVDLPRALATARSQAGLPVQDLAAMFGIKRRQFYNLLSGEDRPDMARELRIARVANAVAELSRLVGGNSRKVRALLLARFENDSLYDAAVADDEDRLEWALARASSVAATDVTPPVRLAPSSRASSEEAIAVREFLRSTRDDVGKTSD
jgi:hypothetical protein